MIAQGQPYIGTNPWLTLGPADLLGVVDEPVVVNGKVYVTSWNGEGPGIVFGLGL